MCLRLEQKDGQNSYASTLIIRLRIFLIIKNDRRSWSIIFCRSASIKRQFGVLRAPPPFHDPKFFVFSKLIFSFLSTDWSILYLSTIISWLFVEISSSYKSIREGTCTSLLSICLIENLISTQEWKIRLIYGLSTISHRSAMSKNFFDICSTCVRVRSR